MTRLEVLKKEESELKEKLSLNTKEQRLINEAIYCELHNIAIGQKIRYMDGNTEREGIISHFEFWSENTVARVIVLKLKKDGTPGRTTRLWNIKNIIRN